jgi:hypothetical protein
MKKSTKKSTIMIPQKPMVDDFWTHDIPLFQGVFTYYRNKPQPVRGKVHLAEERYFEKHEIIPMTTPRGTQTYVMLHPYVFEPKMILTIGLYKKPKSFADQAPAIGETIGPAKQEGVKEQQIGEAQAWYYHEDKILVLWECFLWEFVRDHPLTQDPQMKLLWQGFEAWLLQQFPQATQIATPFDDPLFEREDYQTFLRSLGYEPIAKAAFGKKLR